MNVENLLHWIINFFFKIQGVSYLNGHCLLEHIFNACHNCIIYRWNTIGTKAKELNELGLWRILEPLSKFPVMAQPNRKRAFLHTTDYGERSRILKEYVLNSSFYSHFNREFSDIFFIIRVDQHVLKCIYMRILFDSELEF